MAKTQKRHPSEPFYEQIRIALNHFAEPEWLGSHSPLAAPYFLGVTLQHLKTSPTAADRGRVLQREIQTAAASLWPGDLPHDKDQLLTAVNAERRASGNKGNAYYYFLLELRYLRYYFKNSYPRAEQETDIREFVWISRGPYFNHVKAAREALGQALLRRLQPTLRLERPFRSQRPLIGRQADISHAQAALTAHQVVAISGMAGTGKTSLAAAIVAREARPAFWFTLRPTLNDQLHSLLFSLAYFLYRQGAASLWLQLVADRGVVEDPNLALALVRGDLEGMQRKRPLLCIDEVDYLYSDDPDRELDSHLQIRAFLSGLQSYCPLLWIGQRHVMRADIHIPLSGLDLAQTIALLADADIPFTAVEAQQLHDYTGGNPRLLNLCISLYDHGKPLNAITTELSQAPAFQALFTYLWLRLTRDERIVMQSLAVFRSPAPRDAWHKQMPALKSLLKRQIVQQDERGGVALLPSLRDFIYADRRWLSADAREKHHLWAAGVRAARGEYTAAAFHYLQAGEAEKAIHVWFGHRQQEIERGQASAALVLFDQIPLRRLPQPSQKALALMRAELHQLAGEAEKGVADLEAVEWVDDSELTADAILLQSSFQNALGYPETAVTRSEAGMAVIMRLLQRLTRYRYQRGTALLKQRQMDAAWQEAQLAQYEASRLQGLVEEEQGDFSAALLSYQQALAVAKSGTHERQLAQINQELAALYGRLGQLDAAQPHAQEALRYYAQSGDRLSQEKLHCNLSQAYIQAGEFEKAVAAAKPALAFFEQAKMTHWTAVTAANLAEASFECGQLEDAAAYAQQVLSIDVPHTYPYAWYTLGLVARQEANNATAINAFQTCQQIAAANEDIFIEAYAWLALGEIWLTANKHQEAHMSLLQARQQFKQMSMPTETQQAENLLAQLQII